MCSGSVSWNMFGLSGNYGYLDVVFVQIGFVFVFCIFKGCSIIEENWVGIIGEGWLVVRGKDDQGVVVLFGGFQMGYEFVYIFIQVGNYGSVGGMGVVVGKIVFFGVGFFFFKFIDVVVYLMLWSLQGYVWNRCCLV